MKAYLFLVTMCGAASLGIAGTSREKPVDDAFGLALEPLWRLPVVYSNEQNPWIEEFRFTGRFHGDVYSADSAQGADSDWVVRRLRLGAKMKFLQDFEAGVEVDFAAQEAWAVRITDAYLRWKPSDLFDLRLVKHAVRFTLDGATSSNELLTLQRNNLSNNFWFGNDKYLLGATVVGKADPWQWRAGIYSLADDYEFGSFSEGYLGVLSLGYDFDRLLGVKQALLRLDYVYNDPRNLGSDERYYSNVASLNFQFSQKRWGVNSDLTFGIGGGRQSDGWGFVIEPWYQLTPRLQMVARYTYLSSDDKNGLVLNSHYEGAVVTKGRGDEYNELYLGANYYIFGHKLKLQTGWQYATMKDVAGGKGEYAGWTVSSGVRFSF